MQLNLDKPRSVWVALLPMQIPQLDGQRWVAIQINAATLAQATEVDYFITNAIVRAGNGRMDCSNLLSTWSLD